MVAMDNAYLLRITSQRGGVGKTTVAVNLAVALGMQNYKTLLVDSDTVSPTVSFCLGIEGANIGVREIMSNQIDAKEAIIRHDSSGIDVLPCTIAMKEFPAKEEIMNFVLKLRELKGYDFIIVDTPPGFYYPETARLYNEALLVSTPSISSVASAIKLGVLYEKVNVKHSLIVNRVTNKRYETTIPEIENAYGAMATGVFPEDPKVSQSEASRIPLYLLDPTAPFAQSMRTMSRFYASKLGGSRDVVITHRQGFVSAFIAFFKRIFS